MSFGTLGTDMAVGAKADTVLLQPVPFFSQRVRMSCTIFNVVLRSSLLTPTLITTSAHLLPHLSSSLALGN